MRNWECKQNITKDDPIVVWDYKGFRNQKPKTKHIPQYHTSNTSDANPASSLNQQLAIWLLILKVKILKHTKNLNVHTVKSWPLFLLWYCPLLSLRDHAPSWGQMSIVFFHFLTFSKCVHACRVCACMRSVCMHAESLQSCPTPATGCTVAPRPLCPRDSPGKNTGVACHALLQGILRPRDWTGVSRVSCIGRWALYCWCHLGSPLSCLPLSSIFTLVF